MQHDVLTLSDFYSDRGYAYVNVDPRTQLDPATRTVNITFNINPGREVLVDRINITGNTKTSDKVIRRELQIQEQEPYSTSKIREFEAAARPLGYFSNTRITTAPAPQPDKIDLDVDGAGSRTPRRCRSPAVTTAIVGVRQFQPGQLPISLAAANRSRQRPDRIPFQNYNSSYTEPWFLDMPLGVGLQIFDNKQYLYSFDQTNGGICGQYQLSADRAGLQETGPILAQGRQRGPRLPVRKRRYQRDSANSPTFDILRYKGYTQISELLPSFRRFTVDNPIDPRSGTVMTFNVRNRRPRRRQAFVKGVLHARYFYPYIKSSRLGEWVVSQGVTYGVGTNSRRRQRRRVPLYERFFPGGTGGQPTCVATSSIRWDRRSRSSSGRPADQRPEHRWQPGTDPEQRDHLPDSVGARTSAG